MSVRWDPLRDLVVLQDRMNRLFEEATERRAREASGPRDELAHADWIPPADIYEQDQAYVIALDLPGIDRSALEIDLEDDQLSVRGERTIAVQGLHQAERSGGKFARKFSVPAAVDQDQIAADYKDGVLYVRLPRRKEPKTQRVEIKVS